MPDYGPNGHLVEAFLRDVESADLDAWRAYVERPATELAARRAAIRAIGEVPLPASVSASIGAASEKAFRELGLTTEMFPGRKARVLSVASDIELACTAIAAGDRLAEEHARTILGPFAEVGIESATAALATRSGS